MALKRRMAASSTDTFKQIPIDGPINADVILLSPTFFGRVVVSPFGPDHWRAVSAICCQTALSSATFSSSRNCELAAYPATVGCRWVIVSAPSGRCHRVPHAAATVPVAPIHGAAATSDAHLRQVGLGGLGVGVKRLGE